MVHAIAIVFAVSAVLSFAAIIMDSIKGGDFDRRALKFAIACSLRNTGSAPINAPTFDQPGSLAPPSAGSALAGAAA